MLAPVQHAPAILEFLRDELLDETAAVRGKKIGLLLQLPRRDRRHERVGVELAVGMRERHADFDAAVLELEDVVDVVALAELEVAIGPDLAR